MKKKILYLMPVDWGWIKQRPHFIAENLSAIFNVVVFYPYSMNRKVMTSNPTHLSKFPIITLPFKRYKIFDDMSMVLQKAIFSFVIKVYKPEYIWVSHPILYPYLPKVDPKKHKIIYDCMDDVLGFSNLPRMKEKLKNAEEALLKKSDLVFVSSENLKRKVQERGCDQTKISVVRNGYNGEILDTKPIKAKSSKIFKLAYIGTISEWVNFQLIEESLKRLENIEFHFYGPTDCVVPTNKRIIFHGTVNHKLLYETIVDCDCLIMPFKINELILSVDPVKLYEYINFNKNIITIKYPEIERFGEFVHFYNDTEEFIEVVNQLIQDNHVKYSEKQRIDFLKENNWAKRTEVVTEKILEN